MKIQRKKVCQTFTLIIYFSVSLAWMYPSLANAENSDLTTFGDIMQIALPAAGLVGTFIADDPEGRYQWAKSVGGGAVTVQVWKVVVDKTRPDSQGSSSFPSGHTFGAFSGASFINRRYGLLWGIPAYACAIVTGYSRVDADAHFWDDVVAGASTAMMFNWYFTSPYSERVSLMPAEMGDGYGMKLTITDSTGSSDKDKKGPPSVIKYPTYTYLFRFGPVWQDKNVVRAPNQGGTEFDFNDYENIDEPMTTSDIYLDVKLAERHQVVLGFAPYENRDRSVSTDEFTFGDQVFPANGETLSSSYRLFELRAQYSYGLLYDDYYSLFVGGGLAWEKVSIKIGQGNDIYNPNLYEKVDDTVFLPYIYLRGGYYFTEKVEGFVEMDGIALNEDKIFNLMAGANYHFNQHWYAGAGYAYSYRQIDTDVLFNEFQFQGILAHVAYTF